MEICQIAAIGRSGQLGFLGKIPFRHPEDLGHFKKITMGHALIMGRNTMESLPHALPGRTNIFLSQEKLHRPGFIHKESLEAALDHARSLGCEKCFIIGGSTLYKQTFPLCQFLYLSIFDYNGPADVFWPDHHDYSWKTLSEVYYPSYKQYPSFTLYTLCRT